MRRQTHVRLLVDFINSDYYWAYDEMIYRLSPLLQTPQIDPRLIERLDFRPDLQRGSKNQIYIEIARLLKSGSSVLKRKYNKNDWFRWLADPNHTNLGVKFLSLQGSVNKAIKSCF